MLSFLCLFRHGVFYLPKAHKKIQEHGSFLFALVGKPVLIKHSQHYHLLLCRLLATASCKVLGRCVLKLCSSEYVFEDNVFRVDVCDKTILTVASFLELLISFLPVSRDSTCHLPGLLTSLWFWCSFWSEEWWHFLYTFKLVLTASLSVDPFPIAVWLSA